MAEVVLDQDVLDVVDVEQAAADRLAVDEPDVFVRLALPREQRQSEYSRSGGILEFDPFNRQVSDGPWFIRAHADRKVGEKAFVQIHPRSRAGHEASRLTGDVRIAADDDSSIDGVLARPEVDAAVKELLEENNLDLILPSEAVVYVKPEMNLTSQLLEKLNR